MQGTSQVLSCESSKNLLGRIRSGFMSSESLCESANGGDCACSYDKLMISDEISAKNKEQLGKFKEEMINVVHKTMNEEKRKKQKAAKPSKPPRPPRGPSLDASDMKLLKEITVLNLKRKRMERRRTLKKIKKEKASSWNSNLFACLVTIVFFLVIIFQALEGS
ncbi:hypothetical protein DH2020_045149 [Rehmannia glutinosa]|uniref:Transmembrane protein n=1 Tax=Rehmannia glutinosa TaxID=99300 RepID=A0ABR0UF38_REHGL